MKILNAILLSAGLVLMAAATAFGDEMEKPDTAQAENTSTYPIDYCIVSGEELGGMGDPVIYNHDGREIRFCCNGCVSSFEKNPKRYLAKLDKTIIKAQSETYPVDVCVVSGEKLGGMGKPVNYIHNNQLVKFCCNGCISTFEKDPEKYLSLLNRQAGEGNGSR